MSVDLYDTSAQLPMDITSMYFPDSIFDLVICSNVLEHIQQDIDAIREIYRVLKPDGWALIMVPIWADHTEEDPMIVSPEDRMKHFGQYDHVRNCGTDYYERLGKCGFRTVAVKYSDLFNERDAKRQGLICEDELVVCSK